MYRLFFLLFLTQAHAQSPFPFDSVRMAQEIYNQRDSISELQPLLGKKLGQNGDKIIRRVYGKGRKHKLVVSTGPNELILEDGDPAYTLTSLSSDRPTFSMALCIGKCSTGTATPEQLLILLESVNGQSRNVELTLVITENITQYPTDLVDSHIYHVPCKLLKVKILP